MQSDNDLSQPYEKWAQDPAAVRSAAARLKWDPKRTYGAVVGCMLFAAVVVLVLLIQVSRYSNTVFLPAYDAIPVAAPLSLMVGAIALTIFVGAKVKKVIIFSWGAFASLVVGCMAGIFGLLLLGHTFVAHVWTDATSKAVNGELLVVSSELVRRRGCSVRYKFFVQGREGRGWCGSRSLRPGGYPVSMKVSAFGSLVYLPNIPFE